MARLLAFVLFALVSYGATAEIAHKHGSNLAGNDGQSAVTSRPNGDGSSINDSRTLGNCLVCQLHQNLSSTVLTAQPGLVAPQIHATRRPAVEHFYLSQSNTPHSGRGPPLTSLN